MGPRPLDPVGAAQRAAQMAVRRGELAPAAECDCVVCGKQARHLHHHDYSPECHLEVVPLCMACHKGVHHGKIPDPWTGEVRSAAWWRELTAKERAATEAARIAYYERIGKRGGTWFLRWAAACAGVALPDDLPATPSPAPAEVGR